MNINSSNNLLNNYLDDNSNYEDNERDHLSRNEKHNKNLNYSNSPRNRKFSNSPKISRNNSNSQDKNLAN